MRPALLASGLVGLVIDGILTSIGLGIRLGGALPAFLAGWVAWAAVLVLLGISATDFPVMLFALRKIATDPKRASHWPLSIATAIFVLFAGVYGLVGLLLTDLLFASLFLSGLGLARFASALVVVRWNTSHSIDT